MSKKMSKAEKALYEKTIQQISALFADYFNEYFANHREIKNISFYTMSDDLGYSVILEYENFTQYVNYFFDYFSAEKSVVNSCFKFNLNGEFFCNFDDVLDMIDSDDLSFYTYSNCFDDTAVLSAISEIMSATEKYIQKLNDIAHSDLLKKKYIKDNFDEDEPFDKIEEVIDITYVCYYKIFLATSESLDDYYKKLKKDLAKKYRKNTLETLYEKRAYRVLNNLTKADIKKLDKELEKSDKASKKDKFLMYLPVIVIAVIFAVIFAIIGYRIDKNIYADCIGRNSYLSVFAFGFVGVWISLIVSLLLPDSIYKFIVKKDKYDSFKRMVNSESILGSTIYKVLVCFLLIIACLAIAVFFTFIFCFNGVAFKENSIVYREYGFSQMETYSFENTEIAILEGSYSDSEYREYEDTAYAFKLGDEWVNYGVPTDDETTELIESNIKNYNKQVKTVKSIEDLE
ncbi:MAG: YIP1 family protein [Eubacterium sp.]|nr:YIP1 family protein [Eubacterium sp.]